jgi:hypothetical protein
MWRDFTQIAGIYSLFDPFLSVLVGMPFVIINGRSLRLKWLSAHFDIDLLNLGGKGISHIAGD